jgi:alginate O-acetyltransferase complex protein AlgI
VIHDVVISLPASGGFGGPTLFFIIQAVGISLERSMIGKTPGLQRGMAGWLFTLFCLLLPAPLLFHWPFCERVVLPMLDWLGS